MLEQLSLPLDISQEQTFNTFLTGSCNGEAFSWLKLWPDFPLQQTVIYGESGCGKSHLGKALIHQTMGKYASLLKDVQEPNHLFEGNPSLLIIDDYDFIEQEDWLFHVYNMAKEMGTPVLYFGKNPPVKHPFRLADLASRMRSLHSIEIATPDEKLFKELLQRRLRDIGVDCSDEISEYLFRRLERSYDAIHTIVDRIDVVTLQQQRPLTVPLLREILGESRDEEYQN